MVLAIACLTQTAILLLFPNKLIFADKVTVSSLRSIGIVYSGAYKTCTWVGLAQRTAQPATVGSQLFGLFSFLLAGMQM